MRSDRYFHAATPLASGRVLVTGGTSQNTWTVATELYLGGAYSAAPRPSLAISGAVAYVAWHELDAQWTRAYVKHFDGTSWIQDGTSLNIDPARAATFPRIAMAGATPYVAWEEKNATASQIQVKHWNGLTWLRDGAGSLNVNPLKSANAPAIAISGVTPYVAWQEAGAFATQVYVRYWNAGTFALLGGSLNVNVAKDATAPVIAVFGTTPYVAWQEVSPMGHFIYVKHWNGMAWVSDGMSLNANPAADALEPALALLGSVPYVTWRETLGGSTQLYEAHLSGAAWVRDGLSFGLDGTHEISTPSIGFYNTTPYVAWREEAGGIAQTYVKHYNGAGWLPNGGSLNTDATMGALPPSIGLVGADPFVAWAESTGSMFSVYVKALQ